ncbi:MAG: alanine dehydrogenase [Gammaproteobacteria bacterium]|nr:alanine dehydrogenase [Gammaproteobacteria bacterium]
MKIGIPKEIKTMEGRVALSPQACANLISNKHSVFIEQSAGLLSGYSDEAYQQSGCQIASSAKALYAQAELIVKVKEPQAQDLKYLQPHHTLFCFLHLAANKQLADQLCDSGCTAIAFEDIENEQHQLPILASMSQIAGRLAVQIGTHLLHQPMGGCGLLLGGVANAERGKVVVLGAGVAGEQAAQLAANIGAEVMVFDIDTAKLDRLQQFSNNINTQFAYAVAIEEALKEADLVIGAVLVAGKKAPHIVTEEMVKSMKKNAVIIDIAIDQGGCVETMNVTDYLSPTFIKHDVIHFGVANMPGAVPRTASQVLSSVITPSVLKIAGSGGLEQESIKKAVNIQSGNIVHAQLLEQFKMI